MQMITSQYVEDSRLAGAINSKSIRRWSNYAVIFETYPRILAGSSAVELWLQYFVFSLVFARSQDGLGEMLNIIQRIEESVYVFAHKPRYSKKLRL